MATEAIPRKKRPAAKKAAARKPVATRAAARKSAVKKSAPKKSAPKKSAVRKPAANRAAPKKPATKTPAAGNARAKATKPAAGAQPLMDALRAEHRHMAQVMKLFAEQLDAIENGELVDTHVVYEIMDYMVRWPDRFHHPREDMIYARVAELDGGAADEVDTLQRDHDQTARRGKRVLQEISRWREGELSGAVVIRSGRDYIDHIHEHMNVEEKLVFPHIEAVLTLQDWRELAEDDQLQGVADSILGPQIQREFRNMTRKLRRSLRRGVERGAMVEWIGIEAFMESLEVVSIAYESARDTTADHVRGAFRDSLAMLRDDFVSAPLKIAGNNARVTFRILGDVAQISTETLGDLNRVNQERRDRVRMLSRNLSRTPSRR